jgi:hypothetical protein
MRAHPPFNPGPAVNGNTDFSSRYGADELAARVRAAWAKVGVEVETRVTWNPQAGSHCVSMPGLVNGLPTRRAWA